MNSYPSYKDSGVEWIGEIPSEWGCFRLGVIGEFSSSGIDKKSKEGEVDVRMVNYTDLIKSRKYNPILNGDKDFMKVTTPQSKLNEHNLRKGDMVFIPSSETYEDLGYSSLIDFDEDDIVYSYHILRFRNHKPIYHFYKKYLINHHSVLNQFSSEGKGTTRQIIGRNVFRNVRVVLPPKETQTQIVSFLDIKTQKIDDLIEKTEKKIELLKEKRTSLINHCVTKGLPVEVRTKMGLNPNVEMKDSGVEWIGEIPSHWDKIPFKYEIELLTDFTSNGSFKSLRENVEYLESGYSRLVRLTDLRVGLKNDGIYLSKESHNFLKKSELFGGEILISCVGHYTGFVTKMLYNQGISTLGPNMYLVRNKTKTSNTDFLIYLINSDLFQYGLKFGINKTTQEKINKDNVKDLQIVRPPLPEQTQIVEYLDKQTQKIDTTIEKETKRIELLKEYRQSLISEVVTGKVDVRDWKE